MKNDGKKLIDIFSISHRPIEKRHQIRHIPKCPGRFTLTSAKKPAPFIGGQASYIQFGGALSLPW